MNTGKNASGWNYNHFTLWILTTFFGFCFMFVTIWIPLAILVKLIGGTMLVNGVTHVTEDYMAQFVAVPLIVLAVSLLQYLVLRFSLARMAWWFWATCLGWMLAFGGVALNFGAVYLLPQDPLLSAFLSGLLIGIVIGLIQWLVLRARATGAGWIIPANALGWAIASTILSHGAYFTVIMFALTIPNILTGLAFWFLIDRRPAGRGANMPSGGQLKNSQQLSS